MKVLGLCNIYGYIAVQDETAAWGVNVNGIFYGLNDIVLGAELQQGAFHTALETEFSGKTFLNLGAGIGTGKGHDTAVCRNIPLNNIQLGYEAVFHINPGNNIGFQADINAGF